MPAFTGLNSNSRSSPSYPELELEEKSWEQFYLAKRENFRAMARQALEDYQAGRTTGITITEDGRLAPA
jgi:hypothetical protein